MRLKHRVTKKIINYLFKIMKLKVNDKIFFSDKWGYTNPGVVIDTNYTLPYGGPIVDGKVTDLEGLVQVLSSDGINTIIDKSQVITIK